MELIKNRLKCYFINLLYSYSLLIFVDSSFIFNQSTTLMKSIILFIFILVMIS